MYYNFKHQISVGTSSGFLNFNLQTILIKQFSKLNNNSHVFIFNIWTSNTCNCELLSINYLKKRLSEFFCTSLLVFYFKNTIVYNMMNKIL